MTITAILARMTNIDAQFNAPTTYRRILALDFSPFDTALQALRPTRITELNELVLEATVSRLRELLGSGKVSTEELTMFYLYRIRVFDVGRLNSVIELNPDALGIARRLDQERATSGVKAHQTLHGIPVLIKGNIGTGDAMSTSAGAAALASAYADRDAFVVARLRQAGALLLGKNNLSEWANWMSVNMPNGFSALGGQTRNPYGRFDVAGSSSGSAVSAAATLAALCVGTETVGSIVAPSALNSVVGMHPSLGLLSRDRILPLVRELDTPGPIARSVTDVALLLNVLRGTDAEDPVTKAALPLADVDFSSSLNANGLLGVSVAVIVIPSMPHDFPVLEQAGRILERLGAKVDPVIFPEQPAEIHHRKSLPCSFKHGLNDFLRILRTQPSEHAPPIAFRTLSDILAYNQQDLANRAPWGQELIEESDGCPLGPDSARQMVDQDREFARKRIEEMMTQNGSSVLMSIDNHLSLLYAHAGYPAITVPLGYRTDGCPVGVTFVTRFLGDAEVIKYAYAFEQAANGRKAPLLSAVALDGSV